MHSTTSSLRICRHDRGSATKVFGHTIDDALESSRGFTCETVLELECRLSLGIPSLSFSVAPPCVSPLFLAPSCGLEIWLRSHLTFFGCWTSDGLTRIESQIQVSRVPLLPPLVIY